MKTYQYASPENTFVHVFDEDGISRVSMLASTLPDGVEILPYAEPPPQPQRMSSLTFLELFAEDELVAIATAAMQDVQAKLWYDRTLAAEYVTIEDPRTVYGLQALVSMELLTAERAEEIKARMYA